MVTRSDKMQGASPPAPPTSIFIVPLGPKFVFITSSSPLAALMFINNAACRPIVSAFAFNACTPDMLPCAQYLVPGKVKSSQILVYRNVLRSRFPSHVFLTGSSLPNWHWSTQLLTFLDWALGKPNCCRWVYSFCLGFQSDCVPPTLRRGDVYAVPGLLTSTCMRSCPLLSGQSMFSGANGHLAFLMKL